MELWKQPITIDIENVKMSQCSQVLTSTHPSETRVITKVNSETRDIETLSIISEELDSPTKTPSARILASKLAAEQLHKICICKNNDEQVRIAPSHVEEILRAKENELREEYERILQREKDNIKERFEFILLNEQIRASYMLREAHRERQEKIHALQTQLQCKNLAALMYVMCTERRRSRLEKLKIIEDYTNYINELHNILTRGQQLILHLSRGYKTAARVDHEWREKMKRVVYEFMAFIYHFAGGDPETNQYLIDLPKLLKTQTSTEVNPEEDPCDCEDDDEVDLEDPNPIEEKPWWDGLDSEERPFVMYGDMADFNPDRRREVLKKIKAQRVKPAKTAPKEWKELAFNEMFLRSKCARLDQIKNLYPDKLPVPIKWECNYSPYGDLKVTSKVSIVPTAARAASIDIRGTMGSILKIIAAPTTAPVSAKTELLGARDSMEITSTTRLRNSRPPSKEHQESTRHEPVVVLNIGKKRASVFLGQDSESDSAADQPTESTPPSLSNAQPDTEDSKDSTKDETRSILGSVHQDSLQMIQTHHHDQDHSINYERVCPMDKCRRMQVDSFMRSLPPYMRANPFTHFEQTFDQYETCTPEQLEILKQRMELKKNKDNKEEQKEDSELENPLSEWVSTGVGVQTSALDVLPPCTCHEDSLKSSLDSNFVFDLADLEPVKIAMDAIHRECLFNDNIEFDRFKVIGQDMEDGERKRQKQEDDFKQSRYQEITEILNKHPSLLDIFQANAQ
ncbi:hypothetical protein PYW08_009845 [Mythimna loreyi]|uniref:Uncharacterized protein n=1 Tax=Mythimna loreyi TaxID=667449 RepID=A0ACC2Q9J3_9NEOP|nr:hypothetical protein PYW08_009845 [Mythimna loreyi]